jgi:hypothetical protein
MASGADACGNGFRRAGGPGGDPVAYSRRFQYTNALIPA